MWERASAGCEAGLVLARRVGARHVLELNAPMALEQRPSPVDAAVIAGTDRVVAVSPWLAAYARRLGASDVHCIPNGSALEPDPATIREARGAAREALGWTGRIVLHHGSGNAWHGVRAFLPALVAVLQDLDARLVVLGGGEVPNHARVRWHPHVDQDGLAQRLLAADVAIAPYPDTAPPWLDPLKIHDCRAMGLPVVGSRHPATHRADARVALADVAAWREAIGALAATRPDPRPRPWSVVCRESLRGITPR